MRVNIYNEEITNDVQLINATSKNGFKFSCVRFYLKSHDDLHHTVIDDDRSAVTFCFDSDVEAVQFFESSLAAIKNRRQN